MTAVPQTTSPDPHDSLIYAVLFAADQISAIESELAGEHEVAAAHLNSLKDELQALLAPFFSRRLPNTPPPIGNDGQPAWNSKVYIPLYSDGRAPYENVTIRDGMTATNWNLPTGYPHRAPVDWTALFPPKPNLRIVMPAPTERPER